MATTKYSFQKLCDSNRLSQEIKSSAITIAEDYIVTSSLGVTDIYMKSSLSETEITILNDIVNSHVNEPLPDVQIIEAKVNSITPFGDKTGLNFDGRGAQFTINKNSVSQVTTCEFTIPNDIYEFSGMALINDGDVFGDHGNVLVKDDTNGTYSGTPNATLNQFATNWNIKPYVCENMIPYTATLYPGMKIVVEYTNSKDIDKQIYINFNLHRHI